MMTDTDHESGQALTGKKCRTCGELKLLDAYYNRRRKSGTVYVYPDCIDCFKAANESRRQDNLEADLAKKREYAAKNSKAAVERVREWRLLPGNKERKNKAERERRKNPDVALKHAEYNKEWRSNPWNKERINARRRQRRRDDPEYRAKLLAEQREYYNRPEVKAAVSEKGKIVKSTRGWKDWFNARRRERYATDPDFFCSIKCRGFIVRAAKKAGSRKDGNTHDILGYSARDLRMRMECQFEPGMSWENHGEWHIDHKKPISAFLRQGISDPKIINALCNLQPMWREDNQQKGATWPFAADNDNNPDNNKGRHAI